MSRKPSMFLIVIALMLCHQLVFAFDDIDAHRSCDFCGMDRKAYGFSRMLIRFEDGSEIGVCSLHCAVIEIDADRSRRVATLLVADRDTRVLIEAERAIWVAGGTKRGVMTERPSWAFSTRSAAEKFVGEYGGAIVPWPDVLAASREEASKERR